MTRAPTPLTLVDSAVLAPVYRDAAGDLRLVFIVRTPHGIHGGQIAFPGGRREPEDADLLQTALREADEEVGLAPAAVEVLTPLPVVETAATGYRIAPYLGRLRQRPAAWRPQPSEVADILEIRVVDLLDPAWHASELWHNDAWSEPRIMPFYKLGEHKLWGATYRIVQPLLPRLAAGEWEI